jgi:glycine cleavage system H protein
LAESAGQVPDDLRYSTEHEWLRLEGDLARVGITDYAQQELGDIVYVDLPSVGTNVSFMSKLGEVESVKVASELFSPADGEVVEVNSALAQEPELVNHDPYGYGWLVVIRVANLEGVGKLLDAGAYRELIKQEQGG